ncbi:MAG: putative hydro-lyase [Geminicoccaceae bacterium]
MKTPAIREAIRSGRFAEPTAGQAPGHMQANLVVLPERHAEDFEAFCACNPRPCPLLAASAPGDPRLPPLGSTIDIRTDLPGYRIWQDGVIAAEVTDIRNHWRDDFVAFALGCSFGFETALQENGIYLPHAANGINVAMYDTSLPLEPIGCFGGTMVVSMRLIPVTEVERVIKISKGFPDCHGGPVHIGDPCDIGIADLTCPDYGDYCPGPADAVPMFWACGVTPQAAIRRAALDVAITHQPGKMLICDIPAASLGKA